MNKRLMIAVVALGLTALCAAWTEAGSLTGTVRSSAGLSPVSGANVTVHVLIPDSIPFPTLTGPDGSYDIAGITPGNEIYVVIAWKYGFRQSYTRIADLGGQDLVFDIVLQPDTVLPPPGGGGDSGNVAGTIFEVGPGGDLEGLSNATVTLYAGGGTTVTISGAGGAYSARIPAGPYAVAVSGSGFDSLALTGLSVDSLGATVNAVVKKTVTDVDDGDPAPLRRFYALEQNYPNPFNPLTWIGYTLQESGFVRLAVYDVLGQEVAVLAEGMQEAGGHTASFDAAGFPGGVYFYRLVAGSFSDTGTMLLLK